MAKARTFVGLDVHATKIVAAVLDAETRQLQTFAMSGDAEKAAAFCAGLPGPVRVAYEVDPTGYGLARSRVEQDGIYAAACSSVVADAPKWSLRKHRRFQLCRRRKSILSRPQLRGSGPTARKRPSRTSGPLAAVGARRP
jgi:hypothetical protein